MEIWNISRIEALTEQEAQNMAEEVMDVKGHTVYFIDFGGYFGYSFCVFAEGQHIYYANDYELHHQGRSREDLREWYLEGLNNKLFTVEELGTVSDYNDYDRKSNFLHNYYPMRRPHVSIFRIFRNEEEEKSYNREIAGKVFSPVALAYYEETEFVKLLEELHSRLEAAKDWNRNSADYWKDAFLREMYNHEYGINWQGDYEVISCFANVPYNSDPDEILHAAKFSPAQRQAYMDAVSEYWEKETKNL